MGEVFVMQFEKTLILVKPDAVKRGLVGSILGRVERKGYVLEQMKTLIPGREILANHYKEHEGKIFFEPLLDFMGSGLVVVAVFSGEGVILGFRNLAGSTDPALASVGTIRGDYGRSWSEPVQMNLVHGSDSVDSAKREISLWFGG